MEINRKRITVVIFALLFILIILYTLPLFLKREKNDDWEDIPINYISRPDNVYYEKGHIVGDPQIVTEEKCVNIPEGTQKEDCYNRLKLGKILGEDFNLKECLEFTDLSYKNKCLSRLIQNYKSVEMCMKIGNHSMKEQCIGGVAISLRDKNICKEFTDEPYEFQECKDRVDSFSASEKGKVYVNEGGDIVGVEIEECAKIKTLEYSKLCIANVLKDNGVLIGSTKNDKFENNFNDFYYYRSALTEEECKKIILEGAKNACLAKISHPEYVYFDYDKDGIKDEKELWFSSDPGNSDTDSDGLTDYEEILTYHLNPTQKDTDNDGLSDYDEVRKYKTHPNKPDTDSDGVSDGDEIKNGTNTNSGDTDKDGLKDADEEKFWTDINKYDTDDDGMSDFDETRNGFDPLKSGQELSDTDKDSLLDIDEIFYGTDRFNSDTDTDGMNDKQEVDNLTNPLGSGDMDFDGDGISDREEVKYKTNPSLSDSDGDGLSDHDEVFEYKTDPNIKDTDKDGFFDGEEVKNGYNPLGKGKLQ